MDSAEDGLHIASDSAGRISPLVFPLEEELFHRRATVVYPPLNGQDVSFCCTDHEGNYFHCKGDNRGRATRATEFICTRLAERLGIRTAPFAIIEHEGQTFFGSRDVLSTSNRFATTEFLTTPRLNELGQPSSFPGEYLARLFALDMFLHNPDRALHNFLIVKDGLMDRICAIDFADADLSSFASDRFPVADSSTVAVRKLLQGIHGAYLDSAIEMANRIAALPAEEFGRIVGSVPSDWLTREARGGLNGVWHSPVFRSRLGLLRSGLANGTLV